MIVQVCDICGKRSEELLEVSIPMPCNNIEVEKDNGSAKVYFSRFGYRPQRYDICEECAEKVFKSFLKEVNESENN